MDNIIDEYPEKICVVEKRKRGNQANLDTSGNSHYQLFDEPSLMNKGTR